MIKNNTPFKVTQIDWDARPETVGHSKLQIELEMRIINNMPIQASPIVGEEGFEIVGNTKSQMWAGKQNNK